MILYNGDYIVTNPSGETIVVKSDKFLIRYRHLEGDTYQARGYLKAFKNPTGQNVEIMAPWGEKQIGKPDCWFGMAIENPNSEFTKDRYIIGNNEFNETYELV